MKHIALLILVFFAAVAAACSGGGTDTIGNDGSNPSATANATSESGASKGDQVSPLSAEETDIVVNEVLGKMLFREVSLDTVSSVAQPKSASGASGSKSIGVEFEGSVSEIKTDINIDLSEGGSAVISAKGSLETILSGTSNTQVFYFSPIYLDVTLNAYKFKVPDMDEITVNGNITCSFKGRFESQKLIGKGTCSTGTLEASDKITLTYQGETHEIIYNVTFKVYGPPFDISSYEFSGDFTLDGTVIDLSSRR